MHSPFSQRYDHSPFILATIRLATVIGMEIRRKSEGNQNFIRMKSESELPAQVCFQMAHSKRNLNSSLTIHHCDMHCKHHLSSRLSSLSSLSSPVFSGTAVCNRVLHCKTLKHTATHCNTLKHTATHCNTLQHTATHCNTLQHTAFHFETRLLSNRVYIRGAVLALHILCSTCPTHRAFGLKKIHIMSEVGCENMDWMSEVGCENIDLWGYRQGVP